MEDQDQTWTQWKGYARPGSKMKNEENLWEMPERLLSVIEFEKSKPAEKKKIRESDEFEEIKKYYDECYLVAQHNIAVHAYRMNRGQEPIGKVEYLGSSFVLPIHPPVPKEDQWELGPDHIHHPPSCKHRISGYQEPYKCQCGKKRRREIFKKLKEIEKPKDLQGEVPF